MAKQTTRTLTVHRTDLDPATHLTRQVLQQVGLVEVTITVSQTGRGLPTTTWTGRRAAYTDGILGSAKLFRLGTDPAWLQPMIDEALAEFNAMLTQAVAA